MQAEAPHISLQVEELDDLRSRLPSATFHLIRPDPPPKRHSSRRSAIVELRRTSHAGSLPLRSELDNSSIAPRLGRLNPNTRPHLTPNSTNPQVHRTRAAHHWNRGRVQFGELRRSASQTLGYPVSSCGLERLPLVGDNFNGEGAARFGVGKAGEVGFLDGI